MLHFLLLPNNIPLYRCNTFQFVNSSVNGHLGFSYLFTIINNVVRNIIYNFLCGHIFSHLLGIYLGVELLGHIVVLCLNI